MYTEQLERLINVLKLIPSPSWFVFVCAISGSIVAGIITFLMWSITYCRERQRYKNTLLLMIMELYNNFVILTEYAPTHPDTPLRYETKIWDKENVEMASRLPYQRMAILNSIYSSFHSWNNIPYNYLKEKGKEEWNSLQKYTQQEIDKLIKILNIEDENIESIQNCIKAYLLNS